MSVDVMHFPVKLGAFAKACTDVFFYDVFCSVVCSIELQLVDMSCCLGLSSPHESAEFLLLLLEVFRTNQPDDGRKRNILLCSLRFESVIKSGRDFDIQNSVVHVLPPCLLLQYYNICYLSIANIFFNLCMFWNNLYYVFLFCHVLNFHFYSIRLRI